ncbi:hypothetical protein Rs2_00940 [Raphanus sativus]|nr:hypothetical protein Rs2_00940 [Raphanus sativus]
MELLKLSKFKLQLQSMIGEVRDLRERERSVTDHLNLINQKQKQTEEEYSRKVHELESELVSSRETQEALERKVSYLQNDYSLLESKQNELKSTIQNLLQSRESFLNAYQESFSEMRCSVEARDRKIGILHQKITSHLALFDSIEKEASAIKNVIQEVQGLVDQKEDVVAGLKEKMEHVSTYEKPYFQKTLKVKDLVVENLISEKEALHSEVRSLEMILLRIQESVTHMTEEDRRVFTSILTLEQGADERNSHSRYNDAVDKTEELACEAPIMGSQENSVNVISSASPRCAHQNTGCSLVQEADHGPDSGQYLQHNNVSGHWQSTNKNDHFDTEDKCKDLMNQPGSECSTNRV